MLAALAVSIIWWLARRGRAHPLARLAAFALAGLAWGQLYLLLALVTVLPASTGKVQVSGCVQQVNVTSAARARVIIEADTIAVVRAEHVPRQLQLSALARDLPPLVHGQYVRFEALALRLADVYFVPVHPRRGRYAVERWLLIDGDGATLVEAARRLGWACEGKVCRAHGSGQEDDLARLGGGSSAGLPFSPHRGQRRAAAPGLRQIRPGQGGD